MSGETLGYQDITTEVVDDNSEKAEINDAINTAIGEENDLAFECISKMNANQLGQILGQKFFPDGKAQKYSEIQNNPHINFYLRAALQLIGRNNILKSKKYDDTGVENNEGKTINKYLQEKGGLTNSYDANMVKFLQKIVGAHPDGLAGPQTILMTMHALGHNISNLAREVDEMYVDAKFKTKTGRIDGENLNDSITQNSEENQNTNPIFEQEDDVDNRLGIFNQNVDYFNEKSNLFSSDLRADRLQRFCDNNKDLEYLKSILDKDDDSWGNYKLTNSDLDNLYNDREYNYSRVGGNDRYKKLEAINIKDFFWMLRQNKATKNRHKNIKKIFTEIDITEEDLLENYREKLGSDVTYDDILKFGDNSYDAHTLNSLLKLDRKFWQNDFKISKKNLQNLYQGMLKKHLTSSESDVFHSKNNGSLFEVDGTGWPDKKFSSVKSFFSWLETKL